MVLCVAALLRSSLFFDLISSNWTTLENKTNGAIARWPWINTDTTLAGLGLQVAVWDGSSLQVHVLKVPSKGLRIGDARLIKVELACGRIYLVPVVNVWSTALNDWFNPDLLVFWIWKSWACLFFLLIFWIWLEKFILSFDYERGSVIFPGLIVSLVYFGQNGFALHFTYFADPIV